ncbi:peroxiredoxin [Chthonobacter rhizosphaerae]|uniref:peroxiredoxin n=1 Tax=Chthonobacter rhizosphaerae TaxID=2735553 RepID=UPI0015EF668F|nr:peroxiredoxin [Chthonobacter rhizosphaerae]
MTIGVGDKLPEVTLKVVTADAAVEKSTADLFAGKKVVLFAVPGAFTPTCSMNHLPGFIENAEAIKAKGVDDIICLSVNDPYVMKAWAQHSGGLEKVTFAADGSAVFTKAAGLDIDLTGGGLGIRSKRYAAIVEDGKVTALDVEEKPGQATVSGAAAVIERL